MKNTSLRSTTRSYRRESITASQVERQIDQMVKFIKQEAEEKANEISVSAEEVHSNLLLENPYHLIALCIAALLLGFNKRHGLL